MHATLAPVAADPELAFGVAKIVRAGPRKHIGVQIGLETGSDKLIKMHASRKALPLRVGVDGTWAEIMVEAQKAYKDIISPHTLRREPFNMLQVSQARSQITA